MLPPGTRLGSYEITQPIAAGGMGVVYKAKHVAFGEQVAIKVLLPNLAIKEKIRHRFLQEAHVQRQLSHANIVRVHDVLEQDGHLAMVMEFIEGPTLEEWVAENPGPQSESVVLQLMNPIVNAIAHAHARKVVHRDLKPANVILAKGPHGDWIPKLTDFGLVKVLEDVEAHYKDLGCDRLLIPGTVPFLAPEQFFGLWKIDTGADVFALGMMLRQLVAGALPVNPSSEINLAVAEMYAGRTPIPTLPGRLGDVIAAATRLDPDDRLQNAMALERALKGGEVPVLSRPFATASKAEIPLEESVSSSGSGEKSMTVWIVVAVVLAAMVVLGKKEDQTEEAPESIEFQAAAPNVPIPGSVNDRLVADNPGILGQMGEDPGSSLPNDFFERTGIFKLGSFTVILRGSPQKYLRVEIELEIAQANQYAFEESESLLLGKVLEVLSDYSYSQVEGLDGKLRLQDDLLASLRVLMGIEGEVHRVYFSQFVVQ